MSSVELVELSLRHGARHVDDKALGEICDNCSQNIYLRRPTRPDSLEDIREQKT